MAPDLYQFKDIPTVPGVKELIDIVLSKTQRKTPTEIHKQFKISRIRSFYMRKVKFAQQLFHDKLNGIINQFPRLDEIHPFYADLCNVLYDRDHYKIALGQCNSLKTMVDSIAKDYIRLLKYADSLYKCKMLKRAALGRMCTAITKLKTSLPYLEEVRQHLGRLPSINPNTRTLILTGYPNVGKSSFMNLVSHANVEVQPYAFTTKSLYVGHFDYCYTRWQIIDTPGILDHPLEERNTIEMTAITALAHIQASVLYILDLSEECGYSLQAQTQLFHSIKPLFIKKPIIVLLNKVDKRPLESLTKDENELLDSILNSNEGIEFFETSTLTGVSVDVAKNKACDALLEQRINNKSENKKTDTVLQRLFITEVPINQHRPPNIPSSVFSKRKDLQEQGMVIEEKAEKKLEKHLENDLGGPGVYSVDLRKNHLLESDEWKYDILPEFFSGKNVIDFVDPEIEKRLQELELEEDLLLSHKIPDLDPSYLNSLNSIKMIHTEKQRLITVKKLERSRAGLTLPQKMKNKKSRLKKLTSKLFRLQQPLENTNSKETPLSSTFVNKSESETNTKHTKTLKTINKQKNSSFLVHNRSDIKNNRLQGISSQQLRQVEKLQRDGQKRRNLMGMKGEGDHFIGTKKPKHLLSGKRGIGKTSRR